MSKEVNQNKKPTSKKYYDRSNNKINLYIFLAVIGIIFLIPTKGLSAFLLLGLGFISSEKSNIQKINSGIKGEKITLDILKLLPDRYFVLSDVVIKKAKGSNQLDHVVVGNNGVFIVETKYYRGKITGNDDDIKILQVKRGNNRKKYYNRFLNPAKQLSTHKRTLSRFLTDNGFYNIPIVCIAFFSYPTAKVKLVSNEIEVFSVKKNGKKKMLRFIKYFAGGKRLSKSAVRDIASIIQNA
jgi:hypothetical protein